MAWYCGLDLGQAADYTALACLELTAERQYHLRHLERFELGTPYPAIVARVVAITGQPPLAGGVLTVDKTGVGGAVVDLLAQAHPSVYMVPITITAGLSAAWDGRGYTVPKKELVSVMQVVLQSRRLKIPRSLPLADVLVRELQGFRVRITAAANETFGAWRERDHDDTVLAVAMAVWYAEAIGTATNTIPGSLVLSPSYPTEPAGRSMPEVVRVMRDLDMFNDFDW